MQKSGVIYVSAYMEAYKGSCEEVALFRRNQLRCAIKNALHWYHKAKSREEKREVLQLFPEEFKHLGWSLPRD